jgi:hypothetical protein
MSKENTAIAAVFTLIVLSIIATSNRTNSDPPAVKEEIKKAEAAAQEAEQIKNRALEMCLSSALNDPVKRFECEQAHSRLSGKTVSDSLPVVASPVVASPVSALNDSELLCGDMSSVHTGPSSIGRRSACEALHSKNVERRSEGELPAKPPQSEVAGSPETYMISGLSSVSSSELNEVALQPLTLDVALSRQVQHAFLRLLPELVDEFRLNDIPTELRSKLRRAESTVVISLQPFSDKEQREKVKLWLDERIGIQLPRD